MTQSQSNPIATNTLRGRHLQLAHQVRHTFERIGIEHRNDDGTVFVPRVKRIAWTPDGDIALIELDESRLWHIPSTRLTNPDTLRKLRRTIGQPIAVLETDHTGQRLPGIWYVVSFAPQPPLPESLRLTLDVIQHIDMDHLLVPVGQFKHTPGITYRTLDQLGHVLIGSATQRGKTSLLNAWIGTLAARNTPDRYQLIIIDAKATTLHRWRGLRHLKQYATTLDEALKALNEIEALADQHFAAIRAARLDNWHDFNAQGDRPLPAIHVVVDELPDFVFQSGGPTGEFATLLARLAGKVLGAGVFLTIAGTQMGSDVLPPLLRANMITRIAFQTSDRYKSLAVLNEVGAEKLPAIKGRALWRDAERPTQLIETQMVYLDGEDVDTIVAINGLSGDELAASDARPFVPTIAGVRPELAREVAEWVVSTGQTDVRSVWAEFRGKGLARNKAIGLLNEWEAVGLLGSQLTARDPRPVLQPFRDRLGLGSENDWA
ncbi:MAG: hypothetical protein HY870_06730 [Chloroflexi bacterium]|nr:hypothetical protein [Chloroflexota bacterium]